MLGFDFIFQRDEWTVEYRTTAADILKLLHRFCWAFS